MARIVNHKDKQFALGGPELKVGDKAPAFELVANDLSAAHLPAGTVTILLTVPSLDTPVCDTETRRFNVEAANLPNVSILVASGDLPFAQKRWCGAAGVEKVQTLSFFRNQQFGRDYGVLIEEGPLKGLSSRAVFVIDAQGTLQHVEYVPSIGAEPNYEAALKAAHDASLAGVK